MNDGNKNSKSLINLSENQVKEYLDSLDINCLRVNFPEDLILIYTKWTSLLIVSVLLVWLA
jgi:hypothetical protein